LTEDIFGRKELQGLGEEKIKVLQEFSKGIQGKSIPEVLQLWKEYAPRISQGKTLSKEEKQGLIWVVRGELSGEERKRFDQVLALMEMMGK